MGMKRGWEAEEKRGKRKERHEGIGREKKQGIRYGADAKTGRREKKKGKAVRIAALLFALGAGVTFGGAQEARAADCEARIGEKHYESLEEAFANVQAGDTVYVLKDCSVSGTLASGAEGVVLRSEDGGNPATVRRDEDFQGKDYYMEGAGKILLGVDGGSLTTQDIILDGGAVMDGNFQNSGQTWDSPLVYVQGIYCMESGTGIQNNYNTDGREDNSMARFAGAVQVMEGGVFDMRGGVIRNCYTNGSGGGVHAREGSYVSMSSGKIWNCYAMTGGAMAFFGPAQASGMTLSGNCAKIGGAVEIHHEVRLSGCVIENNRALLRGGAVGISGDCPVTLEGCALAGNRAQEGSAVSISEAGGIACPVFRNCAITGNHVEGGRSGAIHYMGRAGLKLDGDTFVGGNGAEDGTSCDIFFRYGDAAPVFLGGGFHSGSAFVLGGSDELSDGKLLVDASGYGQAAEPSQFVWGRDDYETQGKDGNIYLGERQERYGLFYDANYGGVDFYEDPVKHPGGSMAAVAGWQDVFPDGGGKDGYVFAGWNTQADGSGTDYQEGQEICLTENLWLYAKWEEAKREVTVTFFYNGGSGGKEWERVVYGASVCLPDAVREGYAFLGWHEDKACTVLAGAAGDSIRPERDMGLYAGWQEEALEGGTTDGGGVEEGSGEDSEEGAGGGEDSGEGGGVEEGNGNETGGENVGEAEGGNIDGDGAGNGNGIEGGSGNETGEGNAGETGGNSENETGEGNGRGSGNGIEGAGNGGNGNSEGIGNSGGNVRMAKDRGNVGKTDHGGKEAGESVIQTGRISPAGFLFPVGIGGVILILLSIWGLWGQKFRQWLGKGRNQPIVHWMATVFERILSGKKKSPADGAKRGKTSFLWECIVLMVMVASGTVARLEKEKAVQGERKAGDFSGIGRKRGKKFWFGLSAGVFLFGISVAGMERYRGWEAEEMEKYEEIGEAYRICQDSGIENYGEIGDAYMGCLDWLQDMPKEAQESRVLETGEEWEKWETEREEGKETEAETRSVGNNLPQLEKKANEGTGLEGIQGWEEGGGQRREAQGAWSQTKERTDYDWGSLCDRNPDTVGWLCLPGSRIDFPVVGAGDKDNSFYLSHDFDGTESQAGCLFMDKETDKGDFNRVIYGHNMGAGSEAMFSTLLKYKEKAYFEECRFLYFTDAYGKEMQYEIIAAIEYDIKDIGEWDFRERDFSCLEDGKAWMEQLRARALHFRQPEGEAKRMITLSTCDRRRYGKDGRFLMVALSF